MAKQSTPPLERLYQYEQLSPYIGEAKRATVKRWVQNGAFPAPIRTGTNRYAWRESDLAAWQRGRIAEGPAIKQRTKPKEVA